MSGSLAQTISFDEIPYTILRPQTVIEVRANYSQAGLVPFPARALVVGQMAVGAGAGSAAAATVYQITRKGQAEALFGVISQVADMCNTFLLNNSTTPLYAIAAVAPVGAAQAQAALVCRTAATGYGTLPLLVADRYVGVIVRAGDTALVQAANIVAAINADPLMPAVATLAAPGAGGTGVVTLAAKLLGSVGNGYRVGVLGGGDGGTYVTGCSLVGGQFSGGAGAPDLAPLLAAIPSDWYTDIVIGIDGPYMLTVLTPELERRYAAEGRLDAHAYYSSSATTGQALAAAPGNNSKFATRMAAISPTPPWKWTAALAGVCAFQLTNDPARQLKSLVLTGVIAPNKSDAPLDTDDELLLGNGWSTFNILSDGTVTLQRVVTCNVTDAQGIPDRAWIDIMRPKTVTRIRYDWASHLGQQWPRAKLADDDSVAANFDQTVATPRRLWNAWAGRCNFYARLGWIENIDATTQASVFVRDATYRNRVNARMQVEQLGNLMVFAGRLEFMV